MIRTSLHPTTTYTANCIRISVGKTGCDRLHTVSKVMNLQSLKEYHKTTIREFTSLTYIP